MNYKALTELCEQTIDDFVVTNGESKLLLEYLRLDHKATRGVFDYHCFDVADDIFRFGRDREIGDRKDVVKVVLEHANRVSALSMEIMEMLEAQE